MRLLLVAALAGGCGGDGGPPATPYRPRPVVPEAIRRACAFELSCFQSPPLTPGGNCVVEIERGLASGLGAFPISANDVERYVSCSSSNSACGTVLGCASANHGSDWCTAHHQLGCDGATLIGCQEGWGIYQTDCSATGQSCIEANGAAACGDGAICDPATADHCVGNDYVSCDPTTRLESRVSCRDLFAGGVCRTIDSGTSPHAGCEAGSPQCVTGTAKCDGAAGMLCVVGVWMRIDCAEFSSHCSIASTGALDCVPDATACTSLTPDTCNATALEMCVNGTPEDTACTAVGLTTCQSSGTQPRCI